MKSWHKWLICIIAIVTILYFVGEPVSQYEGGTISILTKMAQRGEILCTEDVQITLVYDFENRTKTNLYEICEVLRNGR